MDAIIVKCPHYLKSAGNTEKLQLAVIHKKPVGSIYFIATLTNLDRLF